MADESTNPALQMLVQRRMAELGDTEGPLSVHEVWKRCGDRVSYETIRRVMVGHVGKLSRAAAEGLAVGLELPLSEIVATGCVADT